MRIISDEREYTGSGAVLALGMFDGVHIGHRALIARAVEMAREMGADSMVCTFDRHPRSVFMPGSGPAPLTSCQEQLAEFEALGADWALVKPFTREFADVEAEDFIASFARATNAKGIVCGEDYTFGRGGRGNPELLRALAPEMGFFAEIIGYVTDQGDIVSSTLIRELLAEGDFERANRLLGRRSES